MDNSFVSTCSASGRVCSASRAWNIWYWLTSITYDSKVYTTEMLKTSLWIFLFVNKQCYRTWRHDVIVRRKSTPLGLSVGASQASVIASSEPPASSIGGSTVVRSNVVVLVHISECHSVVIPFRAVAIVHQRISSISAKSANYQKVGYLPVFLFIFKRYFIIIISSSNEFQNDTVALQKDCRAAVTQWLLC